MSESKPRSLGPSLEVNPDLDSWIGIEADGTVTLRTGKVELGQGLKTAIARIGAEELDVSLERVRVETADTARGPNEFMTVGSMSMEHSGSAIRQAAAEARQVLLELASERLGAPLSALEVDDGTIRVRGSELRTTYGELMGGRRFERQITGEAVPKSPDQYRIVGKPGPRIDLRAKLTGGAFLQDLELPGLLHGRVVRPPGYGASLRDVDEDAAHKVPGVVAVVRDGSFLAVVAEREEQAVRARESLAETARWDERRVLPSPDRLHDELVANVTESLPVVDGAPQDAPVPPYSDPANAAVTLEATYTKPYHMHGSIGPSAAVAIQEGEDLTIWSHSQGVAILRISIAQALKQSPKRIRVIHADGAGAYGHNGADDAAFDAALLARAVPGRPVLLQWTRGDEHRWEPYSPAAVVRNRASLDASGRVLAWNHEVWSNTHLGRPAPYGTDRSNLVAAWHRADPMPPPPHAPRKEPNAGIHRNADPYYAFQHKRVVKHFVAHAPLRVSSTRGLGAYANVFAIESFMDELAHEAGADPVEFRLRHTEDARARAVIEGAAERADWRGRPAPGTGLGRGFAFARYRNDKCYTAVVVDLAVDVETGRIQLQRAVIAADAGQVVDPDGLANQLEGGLVQSASWTLKEQVRFDETRITSVDWETYPILTFAEAPEVETLLIDRPGQPFLGAGEAAQGPTPAAIANAIFHATGLRLRDVPFLPERVRAAAGRRG